MIVLMLMARRARGLSGPVTGAPPANLRGHGLWLHR